MQLKVLDSIGACLGHLVNIVLCMLYMQREVYPALVLFPAEKKEPLLYGGDVAVIDVMKFVAEQGSNFHHLIRENGKRSCDVQFLFVCIGLLESI